MNDFSATKTVTSRKNRRCYVCGKMISIGEKYRSDFIVADGEASRHSVCLKCVEIIEFTQLHAGDVEISYRDAFHDCTEAITDLGRPELLAELNLMIGREFK